MPDMERMKADIYSVSIKNEQHYSTIRNVYDTFGVVLDPHGAVGWKAYRNNGPNEPAVVYETADPGKFPDDIAQAIDIVPETPEGIQRQSSKKERIYTIENSPNVDQTGSNRMSEEQYLEVKEKLRGLFEGVN